MQQIPFFEMFTSLPLSRDVRASLDGAYLTAVEVEKQNRIMRLALTVPAGLGEKKESHLQQRVVPHGADREDHPLAESAVGNGVPLVQMRQAGRGGGKKPEGGEVIMGVPIKGAVQPMEGLNPKMGSVVAAGKAFFAAPA